MTFGTGYDATTQLCLAALEDCLNQWRGRQGPRVLDLGTGTGILAITATILGAQRVVALDTDLEACRAARDNPALNDGADRIQVIWGGIEALRPTLRFEMEWLCLTLAAG
jgi:ribosomal protein L11 methyltransferase